MVAGTSKTDFPAKITRFTFLTQVQMKRKQMVKQEKLAESSI